MCIIDRIRVIYEGDRAAQIMALTSASMASVPLFAPTLGALITVELGWRFTFIAQAIFAAAVLLGLASFQETVKRAVDAPQQLKLSDVFLSFRECLSNPLFAGYQLSGTFSFCGVFVYISTVAFFLRDVFNVSTEFLGDLCDDSRWLYRGQPLELPIGPEMGGGSDPAARGFHLCSRHDVCTTDIDQPRSD